MKSNEPKIAVVLIVGSQRERAQLSLQSILIQDGIEDAEILLFDLGSDHYSVLKGSDHASVRYVNSQKGLSYGEIRAEGVRHSRAPIVAFVEEHCFVMFGWLKAVLAAFEGPWAAVGGEIHTANPGIGISDTVSMMNYTAWRPPAASGETVLIAGHNSAYRREALLSYGEALGPLLLCESNLNIKLGEDGYKLFVEPSVRFLHTNENKLSAIAAGYFLWHRMFGHYRPVQFRWSRSKKLIRLLMFPMMPFVRAAKMGFYTIRHRPDELGLYLRSMPFILIAQSYAAMGTAVGQVFGLGESEQMFVKHEIDLDRTLPDPITLIEKAIAAPDRDSSGS